MESTEGNIRMIGVPDDSVVGHGGGSPPNRHERRRLEANRLKRERRSVRAAQAIENRRKPTDERPREIYPRPTLELSEFRKALAEITKSDPPMSAEAHALGMSEEVIQIKNAAKRLRREQR